VSAAVPYISLTSDHLTRLLRRATTPVEFPELAGYARIMSKPPEVRTGCSRCLRESSFMRSRALIGSMEAIANMPEAKKAQIKAILGIRTRLKIEYASTAYSGTRGAVRRCFC
jgi:hypothetical protein